MYRIIVKNQEGSELYKKGWKTSVWPRTFKTKKAAESEASEISSFGLEVVKVEREK